MFAKEDPASPRASSREGGCGVRTASSAYPSSIGAENSSSEVVIARMFAPSSASDRKARAATPV